MRMTLVLLALLATSGSVAAESGPTACDRVASNPEDPDRVAPGVARQDIDLPQAVALCEAALAADPSDARSRYQLARVLAYSGQGERAAAEMKRSADDGYRQAQFVYGLLIVNRRAGAPTDLCIAERYWRLSARNGRQAARVNYARYFLNGRFDPCEGRADVDEIRRFLAEARAAVVNYYEGLLIEDLSERLEASGRQDRDSN